MGPHVIAYGQLSRWFSCAVVPIATLTSKVDFSFLSPPTLSPSSFLPFLYPAIQATGYQQPLDAALGRYLMVKRSPSVWLLFSPDSVGRWMRTPLHHPGPQKVGGSTQTLPSGKPCGRALPNTTPVLEKGPCPHTEGGLLQPPPPGASRGGRPVFVGTLFAYLRSSSLPSDSPWRWGGGVHKEAFFRPFGSVCCGKRIWEQRREVRS